MLDQWSILLVAFGYLGVLFSIAYYADKRADAGRSIISNPYIYTLSIAVYCTAWTFYGSVGRAAKTGVGFLPIYIGPTLMAAIWWFVLRKIIRISKAHRITSIADFIASRYGKSAVIGGVVTIIAVVGIMPYISLQLKAVSISFKVLYSYPDIDFSRGFSHSSMLGDTAFYVTMILAAFSILFGTRHIDVTERHEGMVAAIAFESVVKLLAFIAVGMYVTFELFDGPTDLFTWIPEYPDLLNLIKLEAMPHSYTSWLSLTFLSMMAIIFLPRQFQVLVVENVNEDHVRKAMWLFPCYLLVMNIFVLPIAFAGLMLFPEGIVDPDTFVLTIPLTENMELLALFVFIGGLSAATGMVIVATVSLSTMVCNDLVMPVLLRVRSLQNEDLSKVLLMIRRGSIVLVLLLGYLYFRLIGESYALVTIGLISFAAASQFAPAILIGIYWKQASGKGALAGLTAGFIMWAYTLLLPAFVKSGWLPLTILEEGPFGLGLLMPYQLFGLDMFDPITHAVFWSMLANIGCLLVVSLFDTQSNIEKLQATLFVDVFSLDSKKSDRHLWQGTAMLDELKEVLGRFIGKESVEIAFTEYANKRGIELNSQMQADSNLVEFAERLLSGAIGAASARVMVSSVVKGEVSIEGVLKILDETSQVIEYTHRLEEKSQELEQATKELRSANESLKELDRMKDEFVTTVSHELRTPLTSIRAFLEILHDNPDMDEAERHKFLGISVKETERLSRLVNQVLDLAKIESDGAEWQTETVDIREIINDALIATSQLFEDETVNLIKEIPNEKFLVNVNRDRLMQVIINLLSNAAKFCPSNEGQVIIRLWDDDKDIKVAVKDNGVGIPMADQEIIFERFRQLKSSQNQKPVGSGLGLTICQRIIEHLGGSIEVQSKPGNGATFLFSLPHSQK